MTCFTVFQLLEWAAARLSAADIDRSVNEARLLLAHTLGVDYSGLIREPDRAMSTRDIEKFEVLIARRVKREPISYLTGKREFWSLPFSVNRSVLDPRPDSELLVETALRLFPDADASFSVLDVGTGSGCLLLSILSNRPNAMGVGVDISLDALEVAKNNADALELSNRSNFLCSDWAGALSASFDLVVSNPPYISSAIFETLAPEISHYEPRLALDGGEDGLTAYRSLLSQLRRILQPDGRILLEIGIGQSASVEAIARQYMFEVVEACRDLGDVERCLIVTPASMFSDT